ncbi:hypothetical protein T484DRAFT_1808888 [Baffinella frigidus]|nr:hypothetical protein T484DRAFT_1808888 [Cryptophyta sp. CCMP2293]
MSQPPSWKIQLNLSRAPADGPARTLANGAVEVLKSDGVKTVTFRNGTVKETRPDGRVITQFTNGDIKEDAPDATTTYFYKIKNP